MPEISENIIIGSNLHQIKNLFELKYVLLIIKSGENSFEVQIKILHLPT